MQAAQICIENGGIVTQVCTFIHLRGKGGIQFRKKKANKYNAANLIEFLSSRKMHVCPFAARGFKRW